MPSAPRAATPRDRSVPGPITWWPARRPAASWRPPRSWACRCSTKRDSASCSGRLDSGRVAVGEEALHQFVVAVEVAAHRVSGGRIGLHPGPADPYGDLLGRADRNDLVLGAGDDERRDGDLAEAIGDEGGRVQRRSQLGDEPLRGGGVRLEAWLDRER